MSDPAPIGVAANVLFPLDRVRVVLCQTSLPANIGACARAMKTMGLSSLYLVNPKAFPHPDAEALASRATDILERARLCATLDEALAGTVFAAASTARTTRYLPGGADPSPDGSAHDRGCAQRARCAGDGSRRSTG